MPRLYMMNLKQPGGITSGMKLWHDMFLVVGRSLLNLVSHKQDVLAWRHPT